MPIPRALSIRTILGILAIACILPVSLITFSLLWLDYQRDRAELIDNTVFMSRTLVSNVDQVLAGSETALRTLQTSPTLRAADRSRFDAQARQLLQEEGVKAIILTDAEGRQLVNTNLAPGTPLPAASHAPLIDRLRTTHAPVVSSLYTSQTDRRRVVTVAVPVLMDREHAYNLLCQLEPATFSNLLSRQGIPPGYVAAITDSQGNIIARSRDNDKFVGTTVSRDLLNALQKHSEGTDTGRTLDGIPVVAGFSQSQKTGWVVVIAIPDRLLTQELQHRILVLALLSGVALLIGLGAAWLIGNRIIFASKALISPALELGKGKPISVPRLALREANEVGDALLRAGEMLASAQHRANHDSLTGLPNRGLFYEMVEQQLKIAARNQTRVAVLYIDLDGFKAVNDQYGHAAGDALLRQVASRFDETLRAADMSSRLGGDEFAIALADTDAAFAEIVANKLIDKLSQSFRVNDRFLGISASIGIALSGAGNITVEALVRAADDAMYVAKAAGKAGVHLSPT